MIEFRYFTIFSRAFYLLCCFIFSLNVFAQDSLYIDHSFGTNGLTAFQITDIKNPKNDFIFKLNNKIIGLGTADNADLTLRSILVSRVDENGQLDNTFNGVGYSATDIGLSANFVITDAVMTHLGIIYFSVSSSSGDYLYRLHSDFTFDNGFSVTLLGRVRKLIYHSGAQTITACGSSGEYSYQGAMMTYDLNGTTQTNSITIDLTNLYNDEIIFNTAVVMPDSSIWGFATAGNVFASTSKNYAVHINKFGVRDTTIQFPFGVSNYMDAVILNNNKILVSSVTNVGNKEHLAFFKLLTSNRGAYDNVYGYDTICKEYLSGSPLRFKIAGNKIIGYGTNYNYSTSQGSPFVLRLNVDGTMDNNFGHDGIVLTGPIITQQQIGTCPMCSFLTISVLDACKNLVVDADNKIILNRGSDLVIGRFSLTNATLPTSNINSIEVSSIKLYPNPVTDGVLIISEDFATVKSFEIISSEGQSVFAGEQSNNSIDISTLISGLYVVRLQLTGGNVITKKIIVQ